MAFTYQGPSINNPTCPLFGSIKEIHIKIKNLNIFFFSIISIKTIFLCLIDAKTQWFSFCFFFLVRINWLVYYHIPDTHLVGFYPSADMQSMYSSAPVDLASNALFTKTQLPTITFLKVFNFIPVIGSVNTTSATFFSVSMYSKRIYLIKYKLKFYINVSIFDKQLGVLPKQYWTDYHNE